METKGSTAWLALSVLMIAMTAGCAPMTQASRDDREYSRADYRNKFLEERASCRAAGRRIVIQGWGGALDRDGIPRTRVRYRCT